MGRDLMWKVEKLRHMMELTKKMVNKNVQRCRKNNRAKKLKIRILML